MVPIWLIPVLLTLGLAMMGFMWGELKEIRGDVRLMSVDLTDVKIKTSNIEIVLEQRGLVGRRRNP